MAMEPLEDRPPGDVAATLRAVLPQMPASLPEGFGRPAGVLVPLIAAPGEQPSLVFTERTAHLPRHAGEISFPGGMPDPGDDDLASTALREAREEIGILEDTVEMLGVLEPLPTFVTGILIVPFVGLLRERPVFVPNPEETEQIIEAQLATLDAVESELEYRRDGQSWVGFAYEVDGHTIWGATGRILKCFLDVLRKEAPWLLTSPTA